MHNGGAERAWFFSRCISIQLLENKESRASGSPIINCALSIVNFSPVFAASTAKTAPAALLADF